MTKRSFRDAYGFLQKQAKTLREQAEPNIDDLLTIVTESVAACNVCKVRIEVVKAALKVALDSAGVGAAVPSATAPPERTLTPSRRTCSCTDFALNIRRLGRGPSFLKIVTCVITELEVDAFLRNLLQLCNGRFVKLMSWCRGASSVSAALQSRCKALLFQADDNLFELN